MIDTFTSTGAKLFAHQQAMMMLKNGFGQPVVTHVLPTDLCDLDCAFCSVRNRPTNVLPLADICKYLDILVRFSLKSVIISGGGNPILYRHGKNDFNDLVNEIHRRGLEIGLISNGFKLEDYNGRKSWKNVLPETLDKLTWVRISLAGLDHDQKEVFIPDIDKSKTTMGMSYINYDEGREEWLTEQIGWYIDRYQPRYVRLVPDCLQHDQRPNRIKKLTEMANRINPDVVFVQHKIPKSPNVCLIGAFHPVLNSDGFVFPCDACTLNESADHKFNEAWRVCHWSEVENIYTDPLKSLIKDPKAQCPGCLFSQQNDILEKVWKGEIEPTPPTETLTHMNFI